MELKPHQRSKNKIVLTIDTFEEEYLLERAVYPARNLMGHILNYKLSIKSFLSGRMIRNIEKSRRALLGEREALNEGYPYDITLTHRQLGSLAARLQDEWSLDRGYGRGVDQGFRPMAHIRAEMVATMKEHLEQGEAF